MLDRVAKNVGRILITPEDGSAPYYATIERADDPVQEGTPINASTLLSDATATTLGLPSTATPNDAFSALNNSKFPLATALPDTNLNNVKVAGLYQITVATTNQPVTTGTNANSATLLVTRQSDTRVQQVMYHNNGSVYYRMLQNTTWTKWSDVAYRPVILYDDSTGSNSSITLSETSANFTYLEIFYKSNDGYCGSQKVYAPNGKKVWCLSGYSESTTMLLKPTLANISGTSITLSNYNQTNLHSTGNAYTNTSNIDIMRVVGYR